MIMLFKVIQKKRSLQKTLFFLEKNLSSHEQNVRNTNNHKGYIDEISDRNEKHIIGNWSKGDPYKVAKIMAELCLCSILEFCGKKSFWAIKLNIWLKLQ